VRHAAAMRRSDSSAPRAAVAYASGNRCATALLQQAPTGASAWKMARAPQRCQQGVLRCRKYGAGY